MDNWTLDFFLRYFFTHSCLFLQVCDETVSKYSLPPLSDFRSLLSFTGKSFNPESLANFMNSSKQSVDRMVPNADNLETNSAGGHQEDEEEFEDMVNWDTMV